MEGKRQGEHASASFSVFVNSQDNIFLVLDARRLVCERIYSRERERDTAREREGERELF